MFGSSASPWKSSDQKAVGSAGVSPVVSLGAAIELLEDSATVALLVGVALELLEDARSPVEPGMTLEGVSGMTSAGVSPLVTELELSGVSMSESCGTSVNPALFESEEQEVRIAHAATVVINGIPNFLNIP